ncbi:unnamed protein product [Gordionus sp. m RMFG-2023]
MKYKTIRSMDKDIEIIEENPKYVKSQVYLVKAKENYALPKISVIPPTENSYHQEHLNKNDELKDCIKEDNSTNDLGITRYITESLNGILDEGKLVRKTDSNIGSTNKNILDDTNKQTQIPFDNFDPDPRCNRFIYCQRAKTDDPTAFSDSKLEISRDKSLFLTGNNERNHQDFMFKLNADRNSDYNLSKEITNSQTYYNEIMCNRNNENNDDHDIIYGFPLKRSVVMSRTSKINLNREKVFENSKNNIRQNVNFVGTPLNTSSLYLNKNVFDNNHHGKAEHYEDSDSEHTKELERISSLHEYQNCDSQLESSNFQNALINYKSYTAKLWTKDKHWWLWKTSNPEQTQIVMVALWFAMLDIPEKPSAIELHKIIEKFGNQYGIDTGQYFNSDSPPPRSPLAKYTHTDYHKERDDKHFPDNKASLRRYIVDTIERLIDCDSYVLPFDPIVNRIDEFNSLERAGYSSAKCLEEEFYQPDLVTRDAKSDTSILRNYFTNLDCNGISKKRKVLEAKNYYNHVKYLDRLISRVKIDENYSNLVCTCPVYPTLRSVNSIMKDKSRMPDNDIECLDRDIDNDVSDVDLRNKIDKHRKETSCIVEEVDRNSILDENGSIDDR